MKNFTIKITDKLIHWVIVFGIIAVPIFYIYGKGDNYFFSIYDIYKEVLIQSIAVILLGLFSIKVYFDKSFFFKKSRLYLPLLLFFGMLLVSFTQMMNHYEGYIFFKRWVSYYLILFIVANCVKEKQQVYFYVNWFILIGTLFAFYAILQIYGIDFDFLVQNFKGNATDGNPNFAGQYISMIFPLALWFTIANLGRIRCSLYLLATIITGLFVILNQTKGVWIGISFSFFAVGAYLIFSIIILKRSFRIGEREQKLFQGVLKIFVIVFLLFFSFSALTFIPALYKSNKTIAAYRSIFNGVVTEFGEFKTSSYLFRPQEEIPLSAVHTGDTTMQRIIIWQNTIRLIKDQPFLGVGLGNFKLAFQPYRTKKEQIATGPDVFVRRTHNEYLQLWAELGPLGLGFLFMIQFFLYFMAHQLFVRTRNFQEQCVALGFAMSFIAIFVTATFGFALQNPNPSFTLWTLVGLFCGFHWFLWEEDGLKGAVPKSPTHKILKTTKNSRDKISGKIFFPKKLKVFLSPLLVIFIIAGLISHYWLWKPAFAFYNRQFGQALQRMGLTEKAAIVFKKSLKDQPLAWETRFLLANEYAAMNKFNSSISEHLISLSLNPYHAKGHYNFANTLTKVGRDLEALDHYEQAVRYDNMLYQGFCNLGAMYFKIKNYEKSIEYYKRSLEINPKFFSAYYNIAYALSGLGRVGEAIPYLKTAKELQPTNKKILALEKRIMRLIQVSQANQRRIAAASKKEA